MAGAFLGMGIVSMAGAANRCKLVGTAAAPSMGGVAVVATVGMETGALLTVKRDLLRVALEAAGGWAELGTMATNPRKFHLEIEGPDIQPTSLCTCIRT